MASFKVTSGDITFVLFSIFYILIEKVKKIKFLYYLFFILSFNFFKNLITPFLMEDFIDFNIMSLNGFKILFINIVITIFYAKLLKENFDLDLKINFKKTISNIKYTLILFLSGIIMIIIRNKYFYEPMVEYNFNSENFLRTSISILIYFSFLFNSAYIEEIIFRKILIDKFEKYFSDFQEKNKLFVSFMLSTFIFILIHLNWIHNFHQGVLYAVNLFLISCFTWLLYKKTNNIYLSAIFHTIYNLMV